jgi:hypothetical protein
MLPETKGVSLDSMDILFGSITQEERDIEVAKRAAEMLEGEKLGEKLSVEHEERVRA